MSCKGKGGSDISETPGAWLALRVVSYVIVFFGALFGAVLATASPWSTWGELLANPRLVIGALAAGLSAFAGVFLRDFRQAWREWERSRKREKGNRSSR